MRKAILFIAFLLIAVYLFFVAAVNDDINWFRKFSKAANSDSIVRETRMLTVNELAKEYSTLHNKSVQVVGYLNFEFENDPCVQPHKVE